MFSGETRERNIEEAKLKIIIFFTKCRQEQEEQEPEGVLHFQRRNECFS